MKKHRFCRCFQISLSYAFNFQVSFENSEAHGDEEGHNEVVEGYNDQRREWLEADALNGSGGVHEVCHADDGDLGGFLDQGNEFVADNGKDVPDSLRYDDTDHGFPFGKSQGHGAFQLAFRYGLDAGADDFTFVGTGIDDEGQNAGGESFKVYSHDLEAGKMDAQERQSEEDQGNLHQYRGAADDFHVYCRNGLQDFNAGNLHESKNNTQQKSEKAGQNGYDNCDFNA